MTDVSAPKQPQGSRPIGQQPDLRPMSRDAVVARLEALTRLMASPDTSEEIIPNLTAALTELERFLAPGSPSRQPYPVFFGDQAPRFVPAYAVDVMADDRIEGRCTLGPFYIGSGSESETLQSVHGGAIALLFDDALGWISLRGGKVRTRTAYLKVNFRAGATVATELSFSGWVDRVDGRKQFIVGELRDGDRIVADAEALYVTPKGWADPPSPSPPAS